MSTAAMIWILSACFLISVIAVLEIRKSPSRFPWRLPVAAVSLLVFGVLGVFLVASPSRFLDVVCPTPASLITSSCWTRGSIIVSEPQVFTRERLVNDRLREERWLIDRLSAVDDLLAEGRFKSYQAETSRSESVTLTVASGNESARSPMDPIQKDTVTGSTPDVSTANETANSVELGPISEFRRAEAYRAEIRDVLMSTQLDDRHDIKGNTLIRLSFNAAVLAGSPRRTAALIYIEAEADDYIGHYEEIFNEWQGELQDQIDQALESTTDALSADRLPPEVLRSHQLQLFNQYVRKAFVEVVATNSPSYKSLLLNGWQADGDVPGPSNAATEGRIIRERAESLLAFYLDQYTALQRAQEYLEYANTVEKQLQSAIRAKPGSDIVDALDAIDFCESRGRTPAGNNNRPKRCDSIKPRISQESYSKAVAVCLEGGTTVGKFPIPISMPAVANSVFGQGSNRTSRSLSPENYLMLSCPSPISDDQLRLIGSIVLLSGVTSRAGTTPSAREDFLRRVLEHHAMIKNNAAVAACPAVAPAPTGIEPAQPSLQHCSHDTYPTFFSTRQLTAEIKGTVADFLMWQYQTAENIKDVLGRSFARHCDGSTAPESGNSWHICRYFTFTKINCPTVDCRVVISAKDVRQRPCSAWPEVFPRLFWRPRRSDSSSCTLKFDLENQARIYAYTMTPSEIAASELASMNSRALLAANLRGQLSEAEVEAGGQNALELSGRTAMTPPSLIAFSSPTLMNPEEPHQNTGECRGILRKPGQQMMPKACFGWLIRPPVHSVDWSRSENQRVGAQKYPVAVVLSVPSWWKSLRLTQWTCWVDDQAFFSQSLSQSPIVGCKGSEAGPPLPYLVQIPGSARDISQKLGPQIILPPHIDQSSGLELQPLVAGRPGRLLFEGERLWKSPVVYLGDQPADEIEVLPNMQGIVAFFECVQTPSQFWFTGASPDPVPMLAHVWTSEGRADSQRVYILAVRREGEIIDCPDGALKSTRVQ